MAATHDLVESGSVVVKRFTSWGRGEPGREWTVLNLVHRHAPGLGPTPISADLAATPPTVAMSVLPGEPLSTRLTAGQLDALEVALHRLWAVPVDGLAPRRYPWAEVVDLLRRDLTAWPRPAGVAGEAVATILDHLDEVPPPDTRPVLGHCDPNLANYLWDGDRVRIVDFEDAGRSDAAYELATLVEHRSAVAADWAGFTDRFEVDPVRLLAGRRLSAALWLHLFLRLAHADTDDQARRLLRLFG